MTLQIGSIVTVTLEDSAFEGKQAEIVEIVDDKDEDGGIGVMFGRDGEHLLGYCRDDSEKVIRFRENELREDSDWTPTNKAYRLFGSSMWHILYMLKEPFDPEQDCTHENCKEKATSRIMVNAWGVVCEHDVCNIHRDEYHGKNVDLFPTKKQ